MSSLSCVESVPAIIKSVSHPEHALLVTPAERLPGCQCDKCGVAGSQYFCPDCNWDICLPCYQQEKSSVIEGSCSFKTPTCGTSYLEEGSYLDSIEGYKYNEYDLVE